MSGSAKDASGVKSARPTIPDISSLIDAIPDTVVVTDGDGRIIFVNPAVERFFGYSRDQLIGQDVDILVPKKDHSAHMAHRAGYMAKPKRRPMGTGLNLHAVRADGTEFPVDVSLGFADTESGRMVIATIQDRTEQHRHEQMKKEFIATVSHELRTPLTAIAGSIALIASGTAGALPDAVVRLLKITSANCQRLICLVNEILDFAKIESGTVIFDLKPVDIRALVEQEIDGIRGFAAPYGVRVRSDRGAVHSVVQADADLLAQVLNNLLSNAIKYSPRGAEVVVGVENRHGMVRLSVRDHGPGIPDEYRERVFERFVQVDAKDARQRGGAGLGLSIVKEIVGRLNGEVGFEPAPGGGTVFYVTFPRWEEGMESGSGAQQRAGSSRSRESR